MKFVHVLGTFYKRNMQAALFTLIEGALHVFKKLCLWDCCVAEMNGAALESGGKNGKCPLDPIY